MASGTGGPCTVPRARNGKPGGWGTRSVSRLGGWVRWIGCAAVWEAGRAVCGEAALVPGRSAAARRALTRGGRLIKASFAPSRPAHTRRRSGEQKPGLYCVTTAQGARLWAPRAPDLEQRLGADAAGRYCRDSGRALPYPTERAGPGPIWPFTGPLRAVVIALRSASRQGAGRIASERPLTAAAVP